MGDVEDAELARMAAEIERLRAKIKEMGGCCSAQEHDQIGCRCLSTFEQNEDKNGR